MSDNAIVERIISDAEEEAKVIIAEAERKAEEAVAEANLRAERNKKGTQAEINERVNGIFEGKAAAARLDCAKILLAEKREVINEIYARALKQLNELTKTAALHLAESLLNEYSEQGDEIVFAENYKYVQEVAKLPVVKERNLKISSKQAKIDGGFMLCGKSSDKDVSYGALLSADRERNQAEIAVKVFTV